nr:hypothetical protein [Pseudomonadota bacterium]
EFPPSWTIFHFVGCATLARNLSKGRDVILRIVAQTLKNGMPQQGPAKGSSAEKRLFIRILINLLQELPRQWGTNK